MTISLAYRMGMTQLRLNRQFTSAQLIAEYDRLYSLHGQDVAEAYLRGAYDAGRATGLVKENR